MNKGHLFLVVVGLLFFAPAGAFAQEEPSEAELLKRIEALKTLSEKKSAAANTAAVSLRPEARIKVEPREAKDEAEKGPTEITATKEASFDERTRIAVFLGNVRVKDPQFILRSDKLTAFLKRPAPADKAVSPATANPNSNSGSKPATPDGEGGGLERAIAEGNVIIEQDKPGEAGKPPVRYVGRGKKADYNAETGDMTLSGWPQVQQGINTHIATEESTVMIMRKGGQMKTIGPSMTRIKTEEKASGQ